MSYRSYRAESLTKEESRVVEIWRGNGRTKGTIGVYLRWVRRFYRRSRDQDKQPIRRLTAIGARGFARWYACERRLDEEDTYAGVRSALQAWSFALQILGQSPPPWHRKQPPSKLRPLLREYCDYRRGHRRVAESTLQWQTPYLIEFFGHFRIAGRRPSRIRVVDIDAFVVELSSRLCPKTIARVRCTLRAFLRFMTATGRLRHDLASSVMSPIVKLYGRRFTIEETFRDQKDPRFGLGLSATHTKNCARRDRLLLLAALTEALLTLLGAASEASGLDRLLKANTSKKRQHSLFRQGLLWYDLMPGLPDDDIRLLMGHFDRMVAEHQVFHQAFRVL